MLTNTTTISSKEKFVKSFFLCIFLGFCYFYIGHIYSETKQHNINIYFSIDKWIPFVPFAVWYYIFSLYCVFPYTVYKIKNRIVFHKSLAACLLVGTICFIFFIFLPFSFPRPELSNNGEIIYSNSAFFEFSWDSISTYYMKNIYYLDSPTNTFPSLHVAYVSVFSFASFDEKLPWKNFYILNIILTYFSTLLTKQHFVLDGIFGFIFAGLSYLLIGSIFRKLSLQ
jgi:membrane-associated phospholipid phosphatase